MPRKANRDGASGLRLPDEAAIRRLASPEVFERGRDYQRRGTVLRLVARGPAIAADVAGSEPAPYRVGVRIDGGQVAETACTCPYDWGGACKHVVAALLALRAEPERLEACPPLARLLDPLDRDGLAALVLRRAAMDPDFADWLEADLAAGIPPASGPVDPGPVAARARTVLSGRYARGEAWGDHRTRGDAAELRALVEKAIPFLEAGDGRNALRVLEAVAGPLVESWLSEGAYAYDETTYPLFADLGTLMAEAALTGDLDGREREALADTLETWQEDLAAYDVEGFGVAILALRSGWDDPDLAAILDGGSAPWPPEDADPYEGRDYTEVLLRVLDGAGRHAAYLDLARAAGAHAAAAGMLVRLGRVAEAVAHADKTFVRPDESLDLARRLDAAGHGREALAVAEAGLALAKPAGPRETRVPGFSALPLARWLRGAARGALARRAARAAFLETLAAEDYQAAKRAAGKAWPELRRDFLGQLIADGRARDRAEILLDEGMIAEAVASVGEADDRTTPEGVLRQLMAAAHDSHPDWVIRLAERRAAPIMEGGSAGHYAEAAAWLELAARAHDSAGRIDAWGRRIEGLIERHKRKYKLRPLLEALRFGG